VSVESDVSTAAQAASLAPTGNPALIGLPTFLVGGISLGLWLVGFLPRDLPGALIPAVVFVSGAGLWVAAIWAGRLGQSAVAGIFGVFAAFWTSFGMLVFGLTNGLLGLSSDATTATAQVQAAQATFLVAWLLVFVALTVATLRLPLAFTALFLFVDIAVALVLVGVLAGSVTALTFGGLSVFLFCLVGGYLFIDGMGQELGGRASPLGRPMVH
jgi:succinate-acetate transporter protein